VLLVPPIQVHKAVLHDGRAVAVKVQYPGVATSIDSDLRNLALLVSHTATQGLLCRVCSTLWVCNLLVLVLVLVLHPFAASVVVEFL
jgi:hypothetical protein